MRQRIAICSLSTLLLCAVAFACAPYVAPHLPSSASAPSYELLTISKDTIKQLAREPVGHAAPSAHEHETQAAAPTYYDYVVGAGDLISLIIYTFDATGEQSAIRVFPEGLPIAGENEFLVEADGNVTLPYIGSIQVQGLPFSQVRDQIEAGLQDYFLQPQFEAHIANFAHGRVLISGEVETPGELFLSHTPLRVSGAIGQSGGLRETADLTQAYIKHADGNTTALNLQALYHAGDASQNKILYAGDQLVVARGAGNQIFLTGEVNTPQAITMHPLGHSLMEALQLADGVAAVTGDASHIYVLRANPAANATSQASTQSPKAIHIYHLNAAKLTGLTLADQFMLQPRDIVYVSIQPITRWNRLLSQLLPGGLSTIVGPQFDRGQ